MQRLYFTGKGSVSTNIHPHPSRIYAPQADPPADACLFTAVLCTACNQEEVPVNYPIPVPDYRLTSVWMRDGNGKELGLVWQATYYPDGRLKSIYDDRDSTNLGYAYSGKEISVSELWKPTHWLPFSYYRLQLNEKGQVGMAYYGQEKETNIGSGTTPRLTCMTMPVC
jgi:hypothetical protein